MTQRAQRGQRLARAEAGKSELKVRAGRVAPADWEQSSDGKFGVLALLGGMKGKNNIFLRDADLD